MSNCDLGRRSSLQRLHHRIVRWRFWVMLIHQNHCESASCCEQKIFTHASFKSKGWTRGPWLVLPRSNAGAGAESALSGAEAHGDRSRTGDYDAVKFITFG
jgi:hypothetical protein